MNVNPRGFKLTTILDCLGWDLLKILVHCLDKEVLDCDHLKLHILMTLSDVSITMKAGYRSNSYVKNLLFRDYSASYEATWHRFYLPKTEEDSARTVKIHDEAINYLSYVLERRLTLAQNLKDKPTNVHLLFELFSGFSTLNADWKLAAINRCLHHAPAHEDNPFFKHSSKALAKQRKKLGLSYAEISHRRQEQYGAIWLEVGECVTQVPEELSLFDVFEALPLALDDNFIDDANVQKRFVRVIDSLNERYKLLRACGLKPDIWLTRNSPSIGVLKELKKLRMEAEKLLKSGELTILDQAYRCAFAECMVRKRQKKFANATSFNEFTNTEYGMAMINFSAISLDQLIANDSIEENYSLYDAIAGSDFDDGINQAIFEQFDDDLDWVQYLIDSKPELFSEVMVMFFQQVIGTQRILTGDSNDKPLLSDQKFLALIKSDKHYYNLVDDELAELLISQAEQIITEGSTAAATEDNAFPKLSLVRADG